MEWAALIFALTALGGAGLATIRFRSHGNPPPWMAVVHGVLGLLGVGSLLYSFRMTGIPTAVIYALVAFLVAAILGVFMFTAFHLTRRRIPKLAIVAHATVAILGLVVLLGAIYNR